MLSCRFAKGFPHVHNRQFDGLAAFRSHGIEELSQVLFRAALSAQPDRAPLNEIGDDDRIDMPFPDGYLVDADGPELQRRRMLFQQAAHVGLLHAADLIPTQVVEFRNTLDAHLPAEFADPVLESLSEPGRLGQHGKGLALHGLTMRAGHPAILELKIDAGRSGIQVSHQMNPPITIA